MPAAMATTPTVRVDPKGRLTIPRELRQALGIEPGDLFFVEAEADGAVLRYARAENPFDALAEHALREHYAGQTRVLRDFARDEQIDLDAE
jgi:AbrB family looped-hinge helix DNA binding protein